MNYEYKAGWYYPVGQSIPKGKSTVMPDGERVEYKFHIALDPATYMSGANPSRDIVSTFLLKNNIAHKCAGTKHLSDEVFTGGKQYGKMFTVYPATLEDFYIIAKGMQELVKKYSLQGITKTEFEAQRSAMQYEKVVRYTNNTLYYTVEMVTYEGLRNAIRGQHPAWIVKDDWWGPEKKRWDMRIVHPVYGPGVVGSQFGETKDPTYGFYTVDPSPHGGAHRAYYLGRYMESYAMRPIVIEHYMGEGPVDFLWK